MSAERKLYRGPFEGSDGRYYDHVSEPVCGYDSCSQHPCKKCGVVH